MKEEDSIAEEMKSKFALEDDIANSATELDFFIRNYYPHYKAKGFTIQTAYQCWLMRDLRDFLINRDESDD